MAPKFSKRFIGLVTLMAVAIMGLFALLVVLTVVAALMGHDLDSLFKMLGFAGICTVIAAILFFVVYKIDKDSNKDSDDEE